MAEVKFQREEKQVQNSFAGKSPFFKIDASNVGNIHWGPGIRTSTVTGTLSV